MKEADWLLFQLDDLVSSVDRNGVAFKEFLRTPSLSCSVYHLPAGSKDMASAHEEDELYLVLEGRAQLRVGDSVRLVEKGTLMYVHAACSHAFFDIEEDLTVLAFFGAPVRAHLQRG
ncbi:cupin domain-containing protein [Marichromatium gracile]|uniref:Cupin n=2 Tax=Marichromatium TaxID=85076 RepID=W0DXV6_MARPU|nr:MULTISPECIES: cupin domain-containing protein [Marichromatium]MBO8086316.1 cupin domain-containing protein [Marichromatium sp.]AHF03272.1 cupin [Marichromatium purpuratum 984]MBK1709638.1 cupin domain-containing protein [Marichromatium gracile]MCF1181866.1 cupin domain-containing protein [Marichromatium gracile]RNE90932.1 cupin domain-containing protein [Marichromatium sp. AB31]